MPSYIADYLNNLTSTELNEVRAALALRTPRQTLAQSGVGVSVTGTTTETALLTYQLSAGQVGANDILLVRSFWSFTGSTNTKTMRGRLGSISGTAFMALGRNTASEVSMQQEHPIFFRNSQASQVGLATGLPSNLNVHTGAVTTATTNFANAQQIVLSGQLTNTGETITLEGYVIELLRAP